MKEQELDKYVGKYVKIIDFLNCTELGTLYKIQDGKIYRHGQDEFMSIKNRNKKRGMP